MAPSSADPSVPSPSQGGHPGAGTPATTTTSDEPVRWLTPEEDRAWRSWIAASARVFGNIERDLRRSSGLTFDDYEVLVRLSETPGRRMRLSRLASEVHQSPSRLSQRLDRLTARGMVDRVRCEEDRRGFWAELTPLGLAALEEAAPDHVRSVRAHLIDHLDPGEIDSLARILGRLALEIPKDT